MQDRVRGIPVRFVVALRRGIVIVIVTMVVLGMIVAVVMVCVIVVVIVTVRLQRFRLMEKLAFPGDHIHGAQIRHRFSRFRDPRKDIVHPVVPLAAAVQHQPCLRNGRHIGKRTLEIVAFGAGGEEHDAVSGIRLPRQIIQCEIGGDHGIFRVLPGGAFAGGQGDGQEQHRHK